MMVPFIKNDGWRTGLDLREKIIDKVLLAMNVTSQAFAHCEMNCKSALRILAASSGRSTIMYKLVSSAKRRMEPPICLTMSLIKIRKSKGPRIDPCVPAFEHHNLCCLQTLCWLPGKQSLPIGLLALYSCPSVVLGSGGKQNMNRLIITEYAVF